MMNTRTIIVCVLGLAVIAVTAITAMDYIERTTDETASDSSLEMQETAPVVTPTGAIGQAFNPNTQKRNASATQTGDRQSLSVESEDIDMTSPEVVEYQRFEAFRTETRDYFANASSIDQPQRSNLAVELLRSVDWAESEDYLLPVEALTLKLGLLQTTVTDEQVFKEVALDLANSYKEKAKALEASIPVDPRLGIYEIEQARIVEEVLASTSDTDATGRQEILRARLTQLRTQIYATPPASGSESSAN